jgi:hypothetical protein
MPLPGSTPASGVGAGALASQTDVVKGKLSDGSTARLLTKPDNVEVAIHASAMALVAQDGISLADARTGVSQKLALPARPVPAAHNSAGAHTPSPITPLDMVTNGSIVQPPASANGLAPWL